MSKNGLPFKVSRNDIARQREAVVTTARYHGLNERNAVIVGGAGLLLYGLYTDVPMRAAGMSERQSSDVDAVAVPGSDMWRKGRFAKDVVKRSGSVDTPLPLTLMRGASARNFALTKTQYLGLDEMVADREPIEGLGVLSLKGILRSKVEVAGRVKDLVGVLGAHLVAVTYDDPIIENPEWQWAIRTVVGALNPDRADVALTGTDPKLPDWTNDLRMNHFDHPAFAGVRDVLDDAA